MLDTSSVEKTMDVLDNIMLEYLKNNATVETFTEHPKVVILDEFMKRRYFFKTIKEKYFVLI
jgi:hypothetical protein